MDFVDATEKVQLVVCKQGCGRLEVGKTMLFLSHDEIADLMYVFRNFIDFVSTRPPEDEPATPPTKRHLAIIT